MYKYQPEACQNIQITTTQEEKLCKKKIKNKAKKDEVLVNLSST